MDDLRTLLDQLEDTRLSYVMARSEVTTDRAGYMRAGIAKATFYKWTPEEREQLNNIAQAMKRDKVMKVHLVLAEKAEEAARIKGEGLRSRNERIKQDAATEILDRIIGKPTQTQNVDVTSGGDKITVNLIGSDDD